MKLCEECNENKISKIGAKENRSHKCIRCDKHLCISCMLWSCNCKTGHYLVHHVENNKQKDRQESHLP